jgi:hypothetical protein
MVMDASSRKVLAEVIVVSRSSQSLRLQLIHAKKRSTTRQTYSFDQDVLQRTPGLPATDDLGSNGRDRAGPVSGVAYIGKGTGNRPEG